MPKKKIVAQKSAPKSVQPIKKWPTLAPAKAAAKAPVKYKDDSEPSISPQNEKKKKKQPQIVKKKAANGHANTNGHKQPKKTQRGPRKGKKNKQKEIVQAIAKPPAFKKDEIKMEKPKIATPKLIPTKKDTAW